MAEEDDIRSRKITVYLIKEKYTEDEEIIKPHIPSYEVKRNNEHIGTLFLKPISSNEPSWLSFFEDSIEPKLPKDLFSRNISAVMLIRCGGRVFAITFGYGRSLLNRGIYEERFGLKVVLNSIDPDSIRIVERKNLDTMLTQTRTQTSKKSDIREFGIDIDKVLLKAVQGEPQDAKFAKSVAGADAISITSDVTLDNITDKCRELLSAFRSDAYKQSFPWIDFMKELRDSEKVQELNDHLLNKIHDLYSKEYDDNRPYLAIPDMVDWINVDGFTYKENTSMKHTDVSLKDFLESVRNPEQISVDFLKQRKIFQIHAETGFTEPKWSVFHCLNCEVTKNEKTFVLTEGKWYEIEKSFVSEVNSYISSINKQVIDLPANRDEKEKDYNKRLYEDDETYYALMDRKPIFYGGGHSQMEFCDLSTADGKLIHVKRYSGSSALSHLFNQGTNCVKTLISAPDFCDEVNKKLPSTHKIEKSRIKSRDFEIIFAIISETPNDLPEKLPFFSKITLMRTMRELNLLGLRIAMAGIAIT